MLTPKRPTVGNGTKTRPRVWRKTAAAFFAVGIASFAGIASPAAVHAAEYCGLNEFDQNVFVGSGGLWSNPLNWSQLQLPGANDQVCVPGGVVAIVSSASSYLLAAQDGQFTTLRIEGTVRIESGTSISLASAVYGSSNLINGGVIQVLSGSTFDMNADQNGAPAFQNVVGGSLIQVSGDSKILLRRPLLNHGTIDLTGGGQLMLDSPASAYSGNGSVVGGQMRMTNGTVTYGGPGSFGVLASGGKARGTVGPAQSLDLACNVSSAIIDLSESLVNNGSIHFRPPIAGDCSMSYLLPVGSTLTNNGTLTFGNPGTSSNSSRFSTFFYQRDGLLVNGPAGQIVVNDYWSSLEQINNAGTITVAPGGFLYEVYNPMVNTGTFINGDRCDLRELNNDGGTVELKKSCNVRGKATFNGSSTLRPHWTETELAKLVVTQSSPLAGRIDVITDGTPPDVGATRTLITGPVTGQFANVTSQSGAVGYEAVYSANNSLVQLRAGARTGIGGEAITAIVPARLLDTRPGEVTIDGEGQGSGLASPGATIEVQVRGRAGVPQDASAAVLNVTVADARGLGFVTVFPCGSDRPTASNLNYASGLTVANGVISKIGDSGKVCLYVLGATHALVDITGYFTPSSPYEPLVPARLLETRPGQATVDGNGQGAGEAPAGSIVEVQVTGRAGVPAHAVAAVLNVTVTDARGLGFVTVFPCGTSRPTASNLNYGAGSTVPNNVIAKIGAGGKVCLYTLSATQLIVDINGYFVPDPAFDALEPARLLDTRPGSETVDGVGNGAGQVAAGSVVEVQAAGRAGVPADADAVVLNVTVTNTQGPGFVTAFPCGSTVPTASSLNFGVGETRPNGLISKIGVDGKVCLFALTGTHLIADVNGWFAG